MQQVRRAVLVAAEVAARAAVETKSLVRRTQGAPEEARANARAMQKEDQMTPAAEEMIRRFGGDNG